MRQSFSLQHQPAQRLSILSIHAAVRGRGFELDRSAGRGLMSCQSLILFQHDSELGNAPAHKLFDSVKIAKRSELPRSFADYEVSVGEAPEGVTVRKLV
jgi:CRISPR-associated protein Csd2